MPVSAIRRSTHVGGEAPEPTASVVIVVAWQGASSP
jgi:hypothetical protein